jgi:hypothetical protein
LRRLSDFDLYTVGGEPIVDRVIQFSELQSGMDGVCRDLGICDSIELPRAKGRFRTDKKPYTELLDAAQRERIEQAFDREIAHFGYTF